MSRARRPSARHEPRLLRAIGWATANVHLGWPRRRSCALLACGRNGWLERTAANMVEAALEDWRAWTRRWLRGDECGSLQESVACRLASPAVVGDAGSASA